MLTIEQIKEYHRRKGGVRKVILSKTGNKEIIYGQVALNKHFPPFLDKHTDDVDIFSPTPQKDAGQTERALDKHMGFNAFETEAAQHPGTWKVRSRVTRSGIADYTQPTEKIPSKRIGKHRYVQVGYVKQHIKKTLKDPEAKFRHDKDRAVLDKIRVYESLQKPVQKKRVRRGKVRVGKKRTKKKKKRGYKQGFKATINTLNRLEKSWGI